MAKEEFTFGRSKPTGGTAPGSPNQTANPGSDTSAQSGGGYARQRPRRSSTVMISCRATNPLSITDDVSKVFLDEDQAKATTATRLFRNEEIFKAITTIIIPAFIASKRTKLSMWSTGCSSGEEVYSMAMVAQNELDKAKRTTSLEAFGTDINRNRITEARHGLYGRPSKDAFSPIYWQLLQKYAMSDPHSIQMGDRMRTICQFALFDMRNRPKRHTFFFIVCNHVLQYYDNEGQRIILANLKSVLNPGGFLYLEGTTEGGLKESNLKKLNSVANLYSVE